MPEKNQIFAHSANKVGRWHPLAEHLAGVERLVCEFAAGFSWLDEAVLAARCHDAGKAGLRFTDRLRGKEKGLDHWSIGAWIALSKGGSAAAAVAVQGHHIGLQCIDRSFPATVKPEKLIENHPLKLRLTEDEPDKTEARFEEIVAKLQKIQRPIRPLDFGGMFDTRFLFSVLTDADFLDTEAHFQGDEKGKHYRPKGQELRPQEALEHLQNHIDRLTKERSAKSDRSVLQARALLREAVQKSAALPVGVHTLTAPTGSGKTLSMLDFALRHADAHGLRRIVMVIPYLNILDQTADQYRKIFDPIFGEGYILEHHSLAGSDVWEEDGEEGKERARRLLSENWDAPLILTTNVQILESLFANRPSKCRKLHRLAKSVILFDEAQTLPPALAVPTLAALSKLSADYQASIVFSTATQPAFDHLHTAVTGQFSKGWQPIELVADHPALFSMLKRVEIEWRKEPVSLDALYEELGGQKQALCIVNLKKQALSLAERFQKAGREVFHLSTSMCALHRQAVLETVRDRLENKEPCILIATQCIEAGVDVDFPVVYRAFGPLEAIAQAAGRCNREGRLEAGRMVVFIPVLEAGQAERYLYPTHEYFQAASMTALLLKESADGRLDIYDPALFRDYYRRLFDLSRPEQGKKTQEIHAAIQAGSYIKLAEAYRLIEQDTINVLVPYSRELFEALTQEADEKGINPAWQRRAQTTSVSVFRPKGNDHPLWSVVYAAKTAYGDESDEWFVLREPDLYDRDFGFRPPDALRVLIG